jgi:hypothetical protein
VLPNQITGPPAAVLSALLVPDPQASATVTSTAVFSSTSDNASIPSLISEVLFVPQSGVYNGNLAVGGVLVSTGWATEAVTTVTGAYLPLPTDAVILASAAGGAFTVTLPDASQDGFSPGQRYTIIKTDSTGNAVTVATSALQTIDGASTVTLSSSSAYVSVIFDGVTTDNWWIWSASSSPGTPTGAAGGALAGTYPNPSLAVPVALSAASAGSTVLEGKVTGDTQQRAILTAGGTLLFGSGAVVGDVQVARTAAGFLTLSPVSGQGGLTISAAANSSSLFTLVNTQSAPSVPMTQFSAQTAGDRVWGVLVTGDGFQRLRVDSNGLHLWGSGALAQDTNLYRASAGVLQTDQTFNAATGLQVGGVGVLAPVATTGTSGTGYTLVNGTGNIITWTAPSDSKMHRVVLVSQIRVISAQTGGAVTLTFTYPDGTAAPSPNIYAGALGSGYHGPSQTTFAVQAGTAVTLAQSTAQTAGSATLWAEFWAS